MRLESTDDVQGSEGASAGGASVVLDLAGRRVGLDPADAVRLRDAAAAEAGVSSAARDLALLLDRALASPHTLALRPGERRALARIAAGAGLDELAPRFVVGPA